MERLKVLKEFDYSPINSWSLANPFCIAYCYTPTDKFVIKGGSRDVKSYIRNIGEPMMVYISFWKDHIDRGLWSFENIITPIFIQQISTVSNKNKHYQISVRTGLGKYQCIKKIRRIPRKWMVELNPYITPINRKG